MTSSLPYPWMQISLEEIATVVQGQSPPGHSYNERGEGLPFFQGKAEFGEIYPIIKKWCTLPKKEAYPGDILFSIRAPVGPTNLANVHCAIGRGLAAIRPMDDMPSKYLLYYLRYSNRGLAAQATGSTFQAISGKLLCEYPVMVAPLPEQHRIVAKIEQLFSELDKGVAELKKAREKLELYRQSLLKAAFEGRLTEAWRKEHADELESADELLARIKAEREKRYQQQLDQWNQAVRKWEAQGKPGRKPTKPRKPKKLPPLTKEELAELPELPEGWVWFRVAHLCEVVRGGSPRPAGDPKYYGGNIPFLKVADITGDTNPYLESFTFTIKEAGLTKTRLVKANTLLLSNSGATLGVPKICTFETTFNDGIAAFLGVDEDILLYHYYFWMSNTRKLRSVNQGAAQPNLNTNLIKEYLFPVCSKAEMIAVADKLDRIFSTIENVQNTLQRELSKAEALRQSILKKAFSGRLVPQDPNDEPASELLKRIRAEQEACTGTARRSPQRRQRK
ncbi:MAG: restriction endonuclease subunit S [Deltaproteobacteria bacterium]|nr:restriction endonuclease subunit S [Deltaproteobacteria bacterium]